MCPGVKLGLDSHRVTGVPPTPRSQPSLRQLGRECGQGVGRCLAGPVTGTKLLAEDDSSPPTPFWDLRGEWGGQGWGRSGEASVFV